MKKSFLILALRNFVFIALSLSGSISALAMDPTCAVTLSAEGPQTLESQDHLANFQMSDLFFRDYLATQEKIDPRTLTPATKLTFKEKQDAIATLIGMFAIHPNRTSAAKIVDNKNIYLAVEIGDGLDGAGGEWTAPQRIGLKYSFDSERKAFVLQRISLINENIENDGEGTLLVDHPLNADLSDFKPESRNILWKNQVDHSLSTARLQGSSVVGNLSDTDLLAQKAKFDHDFSVPTVIGNTLAKELRSRAEWISKIENDFLRQAAFQSKSYLKQKFFYLTWQGYTMALTLPLTALKTIVQKPVFTGALVAALVAINHHASFATIQAMVLRAVNPATAAQPLNGANGGAVVSNDDFGQLLTQYMDPKKAKQLTTLSAKTAKSGESPSAQSTLSQYFGSLATLERENEAKAQASQTGEPVQGGNHPVGEVHHFFQPTTTRSGLPANLQVIEFMSSEKILLSTTPQDAGGPSSFVIITKATDPVTYQKLMTTYADTRSLSQNH